MSSLQLKKEPKQFLDKNTLIHTSSFLGLKEALLLTRVSKYFSETFTSEEFYETMVKTHDIKVIKNNRMYESWSERLLLNIKTPRMHQDARSISKKKIIEQKKSGNLAAYTELLQDLNDCINDGLNFLTQWAKYNINPESEYFQKIVKDTAATLSKTLFNIANNNFTGNISDYTNLNCFAVRITEEFTYDKNKNFYPENYQLYRLLNRSQIELEEMAFLSYRAPKITQIEVEHKKLSLVKSYFDYQYPELKYFEYGRRMKLFHDKFFKPDDNLPDLKEVVEYLKTVKEKEKGKYISSKKGFHIHF